MATDTILTPGATAEKGKLAGRRKVREVLGWSLLDAVDAVQELYNHWFAHPI